MNVHCLWIWKKEEGVVLEMYKYVALPSRIILSFQLIIIYNALR